MLKLGLNIFLKFAEENFIVWFLVVKELRVKRLCLLDQSENNRKITHHCLLDLVVDGNCTRTTENRKHSVLNSQKSSTLMRHGSKLYFENQSSTIPHHSGTGSK